MAASELTGRVAFVTGGGRGIGRATALALVRAGADAAVAARSDAELQQTAALVAAQHRRSAAVICDVGSDQAVRDAIAQVRHQLGAIDILVNNAAVLDPLGPSATVDPLAWAQGLTSTSPSAPEPIQGNRCQLKECSALILVPQPEVVVGESGSRLGQVIRCPWLVGLFPWPWVMKFDDGEVLDVSEDQLGRQPEAEAERAANKERREEAAGVAAVAGQGQAREPGIVADRDLGGHHCPEPLS